MDRVAITGLSKQQFFNMSEEERLKLRCYRCKRKAGEKTAFVIDEGVGFREAELLHFEIEEQDRIIIFKICRECHDSLKAEFREIVKEEVDRVLFEREFGEQLRDLKDEGSD